MRQHLAVILVVAGLLAAAAMLVGHSLFYGGSEPARWNQHDEILLAPTGDDPAAVEAGLGDAAREAPAREVIDDPAGDRVEIVLRGRVVDPFHAPVADASVRLDFARGGPRDRPGRERRVPETARTDADGRFAFQGQAFRSLRVTLLVGHHAFAPALFERNLGESRAEMDVGDLQVQGGGALLGRVTDLDGTGVPDGSVRLQPENENRRFERDRDSLFAPQRTDPNGYYRFDHVAAGDWRVQATAPRHEEGRSDIAAAEEGQQTQVDDIRLGPGYEVAGLVTDRSGGPVAEAEVTARPRRAGRSPRQGRGGPGGGPGFAGEHRASTDSNGRFHIDHLPGAPLDLTVEKAGYLRWEQREVDARLDPTVYVTLQDGLVITGIVTDAATGAPVEQFAVRAQRLRGLPQPGEGAARQDPGELTQRLRAGLEQEVQLRIAEERSRGREDPGNPIRGFDPDPGRPSRHPEGRFTENGLQEGVYALVVHSPAHARHRSDEFELRSGLQPVELRVALQRGFTVQGLVRSADNAPIASARVELRLQPAEGEGGRGAEFARWLPGSGPALDAKTDAAGHFAIEHATSGRYRVVASAPGHDEARTDPFQLEADRAGVELQLAELGALNGRVLGTTPEKIGEVRVVAVPIDERGSPVLRFRNNGPFASVQPDGTYRIDELAPGSYAVRAFTGAGMRSLFAQAFGAGLAPDVAVRSGETATFDVTLTVPDTGEVSGSVMHNGRPAAGFRVSLQRQDGNEAALPPGFPGGRGGREGFIRMGGEFDVAVGASGRFTIEDVPAGSYRLTVNSGWRGGALHREAVIVQTRSTSEVTISLVTAAIAGQVTVDDGTPPAELDGSVTLLPGLTEVPENLNAMRRENTVFEARVADGRFEIEMLPPGSYLVLLTIRGRERTTVQAFAPQGQRTELSVAAGRKVAPGEPGTREGTGNVGPPRPGRGRRGG